MVEIRETSSLYFMTNQFSLPFSYPPFISSQAPVSLSRQDRSLSITSLSTLRSFLSYFMHDQLSLLATLLLLLILLYSEANNTSWISFIKNYFSVYMYTPATTASFSPDDDAPKSPSTRYIQLAGCELCTSSAFSAGTSNELRVQLHCVRVV
jgi:hypothetical protein